MAITFRPAVRENVSLLIGLAGGTGSGKTFTAMRLAQGIVGPTGTFAVLDTEAGRARHYAPRPGEQPDLVKTFRFEHADIAPPFNPLKYADAIEAADKAGYSVVVVDSCSHEHAGVGGILDMQEAEYKRLGGRDNVKMLSWVAPKVEHRKMVARLLQVRAHLILCFRAEEKIEMVRSQGGQMEVRKKVSATGIDGWVPICEKTLPFELTASFLLLASKPGVPVPIKLQEQHKALFPLDQPITEKSGALIAEWAKGGVVGIPEPSAEAARRRPEVAGQREGSLGAGRAESNSDSPASVPRVRESDGAAKPAGVSASTGAPQSDSPEDDRARLIAIVETAAPARIQVLCKRLFNDPSVEWRKLDIAALQTLATNVNMTRSA